MSNFSCTKPNTYILLNNMVGRAGIYVLAWLSVSVFENNESVAMESGQSGGVPGNMFLGEIKKKN